MRTRCSWIPIFVRDDTVLLRFEPHWGDVWYWPSVTDDDEFRTAASFFGAVSTEFDIERSVFFSDRVPIPIREFYEEVIHEPSGEQSAYYFRVVDLSHVARSIQSGEFPARSGRLHRWVTIGEVDVGQAEKHAIQPEVAAIWGQVRGSA